MFYTSSNIADDQESPAGKDLSLTGPPELSNQLIIDCLPVLSDLSRVMRTHMNTVVAFSFMSGNSDSSDEEKARFTDHINDACQQMISVFDNFLDSAIIDTGSSKAEPVNCNPDELFKDLFAEFAESFKRDSDPDLTFIPEYPESLNKEFFIDTNRYTRVVRNLFRLSLQHTKTGYIKTGYYLRGNNLVFYIFDTGQGYFKCREFFNTRDLAKSLTKYNDTITALNISLIRRLIRLLNGTVSVESNRLSGSGIYFTIPVSDQGINDITNKFLKKMITI